MAELVLTEVDSDILQNLRQRAMRHGRTPAEEAKTILTDVLRDNHPDVWASVDSIYHRLAASGRTFSDSADLLHEDRNR
jgi:antitoxin FitA